jgi:hypothetical protein
MRSEGQVLPQRHVREKRVALRDIPAAAAVRRDGDASRRIE